MNLLVQMFPALADADPLGVNTNVTFDEVGGLDDRQLYPVRLMSTTDAL